MSHRAIGDACRFTLLFTLLVLTAAAMATPGATATQARIAWRPCPVPTLPTRECGELTVPLDYGAPDGATIVVAVARVPATNPARRIGSMILNPGGPGGPGVAALAAMYAPLPASLTARFDIVGFDPRGVGESTPVRCFDGIAERTAFFNAVPSAPIGAPEETARQRAAEELARRCGERNATLLPHLSTANVARDMDRLRQAVGDEALTYLGASYGTYLGATYANLFPDHIRAMVLDGVIDPSSYASADRSVGAVTGPDTNSFLRILSPQATEGAFERFIAACGVAGPSRCAFAAPSAAETRAKFEALMDRLRAEPLIAQGPAGTLRVTYSIAIEAVRGALYAAPL